MVVVEYGFGFSCFLLWVCGEFRWIYGLVVVVDCAWLAVWLIVVAMVVAKYQWLG